jgi:hypothetical protein
MGSPLLGSTGAMVPKTWQYSVNTPEDATRVEDVTVAPSVGKPICSLATVNPFRFEQAVSAGKSPLELPQAFKIRMVMRDMESFRVDIFNFIAPCKFFVKSTLYG